MGASGQPVKRPCLDCGTLVVGDSRCPPHRRKRDRAFSAAGRVRRGPRWGTISSAIRASWSLQGQTCIDARDGRCQGRLQVDHIIPGSVAGGFAPRCAYHNNRKGSAHGSENAYP